MQEALGSDIMMVLDTCIPYPADRDTAARATALTGRWAGAAGRRRPKPASCCLASSRAACTRTCGVRPGSQLTAIGFDGYALGGLSVGEPRS